MGAMLITTSIVVGASATTPHAAVATPEAGPVLISPLGSSAASEPVLRWEAVFGAKRYRVQIAPTASFSVPAVDVWVENTAATPVADLAPGTWHWRVAGI